jgi:hypothetical protein
MFAGRDARRAWLIAAACTLVALSSSVHATDNIDASHPEIFVPRFIDAMLSQDPERRLAILHSQSRACVNPQTQPYFDWIFSRQARLVRTGARKATTRAIAPDAVLPTDGHSDYPTRPTHEIQIDFISGPSSSYTVLLFVASEGAQWREVLPCPRGDVIAQSRARQAAQEQYEQKVRTLLSSMPHELRAELSMLLKSGRKVDAITRYALATGQDIATSKSVVEALAVRAQSQLW